MRATPTTDLLRAQLPDLLAASTEATGYPVGPVADVVDWIGDAHSWCAVSPGGVVLGHVAVLAHAHPDTDQLSQDTGEPLDQAAELARLVVHPDAAGQGVGRLLHDHAVAHIVEGGQQPLLWVQTHLARARSVYRALGWREIDTRRGSETGTVNHVLVLDEPEARQATTRAAEAAAAPHL